MQKVACHAIWIHPKSCRKITDYRRWLPTTMTSLNRNHTTIFSSLQHAKCQSDVLTAHTHTCTLLTLVCCVEWTEIIRNSLHVYYTFIYICFCASLVFFEKHLIPVSPFMSFVGPCWMLRSIHIQREREREWKSISPVRTWRCHAIYLMNASPYHCWHATKNTKNRSRLDVT